MRLREPDSQNLDLLPADFSFRDQDLALGDAKQSTKWLSRLFRPWPEATHDYIFLDYPSPSISLVSENIFRASDAMRVLPLFTMVDRRTRT